MEDKGKKSFGYFGPSWFLYYVIIPQCRDKKVGEGTYGDWAICEPPVGFYWGGTLILANQNTAKREGVAKILKWLTLDTSETGFQYLWSRGQLDDPNIKIKAKESAASAAVMRKSDNKMDFLGGQNPFDAYIPAGDTASGKSATQYDDEIDILWRDQIHEYIDGKKTREQAIIDFKKQATDYIASK